MYIPVLVRFFFFDNVQGTCVSIEGIGPRMVLDIIIVTYVLWGGSSQLDSGIKCGVCVQKPGREGTNSDASPFPSTSYSSPMVSLDNTNVTTTVCFLGVPLAHVIPSISPLIQGHAQQSYR